MFKCNFGHDFKISFCTTSLGKLHVITEFCPGGNLRQFLIKTRVSCREDVSKNIYTSMMSTLNCFELLQIALDIANGMVHLASQKVLSLFFSL